MFEFRLSNTAKARDVCPHTIQRSVNWRMGKLCDINHRLKQVIRIWSYSVKVEGAFPGGGGSGWFMVLLRTLLLPLRTRFLALDISPKVFYRLAGWRGAACESGSYCDFMQQRLRGN